MYKIVLFYKYVQIDDTEKLKLAQIELAKKLNLKGRMIIATEGVNGTFEGTVEAINNYIKELRLDNRFADVDFKVSDGTVDNTGFPKLSVKVRSEIVTLGLGSEDFSPNEYRGKYITAEEMHDLIHSKQEFYIVDMRNDYEIESGMFRGSIPIGINNFRELREKLPQIEHLKDKLIVTVCTGGVRCEKASGFLVKNGFKNVYQLHNGIHTYMEKYPNEDFLGKLYVFDGRVVMGFNLDDPNHQVLGKCKFCHEPSDRYVNCGNLNCHKHFICCSKCDPDNNVQCGDCKVTRRGKEIDLTN